jgi:hypothetical protein
MWPAVTNGAGARRPVGRRQVVGGVDQADVREGFREVPDVPAGRLVVLLREQPEVVPQVEHPLEEPPRFAPATEQDEAVGEPEGAREEGRLSLGQPVDPGARRVPADEAVLQELTLDRFHRPGHAGIGGREEGVSPTTP